MHFRHSDHEEVKRLRKELTATRFIVYGLLLVLMLGAIGAPRIVVFSAFLCVSLVAVFLGCRLGLGDLEMSLGQSLGVTLGGGLVALAGALFVWWLLS